MYVIRNTADNSQFWNNDDGWVGPEIATRFTEEEKNTLNLPLDGEWIPAPKTITRYYVCGEPSTVADRATSESIDSVIFPMEFPNQEAVDWFEQGLNFADGWLEVNGFDTYEEAEADVKDSIGEPE